MLIYRALLVDVSRSYKRPVQQFFTHLAMAEDWAAKTLEVAGEGSYVQIYENRERELHQVPKKVIESDESALQGIRQAEK
jgi:hypothetical protein